MERNIFVAFLFLTISSKVCYACFDYNETINLGMKQSNQPFYKDCYCDNPESTKSLRWVSNNGVEIGPSLGPGNTPNVYTVVSPKSKSLYVSSLSTSLTGTYSCVTEKNGRTYAITYILEVFDPVYFYGTEDTQYIVKGQNSGITCHARGAGRPMIFWQKMDDENNEISNSDKYHISAEGLVIKNVTDEDEGTYKCSVSVAATGENVDKFIKVEVMRAPSAVEIVVRPKSILVVGMPLSIECNADGFPLPTYSWRKTQEIPTKNGTIKITKVMNSSMNLLELDNVQPDDRGTYECIAVNKAGEAKKKIFIEILTPPVITEFKSVNETEGVITQLICKASGRPRPIIEIAYGVLDDGSAEDDPSITWSRRNINDTDIEFTLTFNKLNRSRTGTYYCNATNEVEAHVLQEATLEVKYKPYLDKPETEILWAWKEKPVNLSCEYDSHPEAEVSWSFQESSNDISAAYRNEVNREMVKTYKDTFLPLNVTDKSKFGVYECKVKNYYGEAQKLFLVKEASKPPAIENVTLIDVKASSATFFIEGPINGGPPVIGFTAEYDEEENYKITSIHENRTWAVGAEYKIDKLKRATPYNVKFAAINELGTGVFTEMIQFDTPNKSEPEPPILESDGNDTETTSNSKVVKLKVSEDNGEKIDYYIVKYCQIHDGVIDQELCNEINMEAAAQFQLDDLEYNTTYYLSLTAHNSFGNSTATVSFFTTPESGLTEQAALSAGALIGVSIVVVIFCIILLDLLLFATRRQGMIANCCSKSNKKKKKESTAQSRDKKGLLKDNGESTSGDTLKRQDNGHKEYEYNKTTGVITGKHSAV